MSFWHNENSEYEEVDACSCNNSKYFSNKNHKSKSNKEEEQEERTGIKWTGQDVLFLVRLWRQNTCLWRNDSAKYLSDSSRRAAYEAIQEQLVSIGLAVSVVDVIMKIHNLRKAYVDELRKMYEATLTGRTYKPLHDWFDELDSFLLNYLHVDELESITLLTTIEDTRESERVPFLCIEPSSPEDEDEELAPPPSQKSNSRPRTCGGASLSSLGAVTSLTPSWRPRPTSAAPGRGGVAPVTEKRATGGGSYSRSCGANSGIQHRDSTFIRYQRRPDTGTTIASNMSCRTMNEDYSMSRVSSHSCLTTRISSNGFDLFAKSLACRLKRLKPESAAKLQLEIQKLLVGFEREQELNVNYSSNLESLEKFGVNHCILVFFFILLHFIMINATSLFVMQAYKPK